MTTLSIQRSIREVGLAIRRPEKLACRWRDRFRDGTDAPPAAVFAILLLNAVLGTAAYGMVMHMHRGAAGMGEGALMLPLAAGIAWALAFPALYILNSLFGSRLDFTTTTLAAAVTVSFGAAAMLASVPITWFFSLALPYLPIHWLINLVVFAGVSFWMCDVFLRVMKALEPTRSRAYPLLWLVLLTALGGQLFWLFGLFQF